jgi:putative flavoprotein involved in K+ transport
MIYDVIIVGAGQAGLAIGYYLKKSNLSFLLLNKDCKVGVSWEKRYDSLVLFTPRDYSSLPGLNLKDTINTFPTKSEIATYLAEYATNYNLPILHNTEVIKAVKDNNLFHVTTTRGEFTCRKFVVATGPFQDPKIPIFSQTIDEDVLQIHSSQYKNPSQLKEGSILIVGCGNSGAQIATELSNERKVFLSVGQKLRYVPLTFLNKSIFWWFDKIGVLHSSTHSKIGKWIQRQGDPIFGYELKEKINNGSILLKSRTINGYGKNINFEDGSIMKVDNIIWATGFTSNYDWVQIKQALDSDQRPIQNRGISDITGLFFLGLPWQSKRGSALLQGVGEDAYYLYQHILKTS